MAEECAVEGVGFLDGVTAVFVVAVGGGDDLFFLPVEVHDSFGGGQLTGCAFTGIDNISVYSLMVLKQKKGYRYGSLSS